MQSRYYKYLRFGSNVREVNLCLTHISISIGKYTYHKTESCKHNKDKTPFWRSHVINYVKPHLAFPLGFPMTFPQTQKHPSRTVSKIWLVFLSVRTSQSDDIDTALHIANKLGICCHKMCIANWTPNGRDSCKPSTYSRNLLMLTLSNLNQMRGYAQHIVCCVVDACLT